MEHQRLFSSEDYLQAAEEPSILVTLSLPGTEYGSTERNGMAGKLMALDRYWCEIACLSLYYVKRRHFPRSLCVCVCGEMWGWVVAVGDLEGVLIGGRLVRREGYKIMEQPSLSLSNQ